MDLSSRAAQASAVARAAAVVVLTALLGLAAGCAGDPDQPQFTLTQRPIISGTVDAADTAVVALVHPDTGQFCSGTVIAPRAVLSAGHCIVEMQNAFQRHGVTFRPEDCEVFFGTTVGQSGPSRGVTAGHVHPQYAMQANGQPVNDLSVWLLAQDAPSAAASWQGHPLGDITGQTVTLVGYGVTDAAAQTGNGTRRTVTAMVSHMDAMLLYYGGGQSGTCQGDSGGPMFLPEDGVPVLVGVTSAGDASCVQLGTNTRVDRYADFIAQYAGASSQRSTPVAVGIKGPVDGALVGTAVTVQADVSSAAGLYQVQLFLDGAPGYTVTAPPWTFAVTGLTVGAHELTVHAQGNDGGSGQASVRVTAADAAPPPCSSQSPCPSGFACASSTCVARPPAATGAAPEDGPAKPASGGCAIGGAGGARDPLILALLALGLLAWRATPPRSPRGAPRRSGPAPRTSDRTPPVRPYRSA